MHLIKIVILIFISLELANVAALYFAPGSKLANAVGIFKAWERSKQYSEIHDFIKYLVNWIAGAKLIFLGSCVKDVPINGKLLLWNFQSKNCLIMKIA